MTPVIKISSNASKEWSGTHKELSQKRDKIKRQIRYHMDQHRQLDKHESLDDERKKRTEQAIETLNKAHDKIDQFLKSNSPRMGQGKRPKEVKSNITDNESAKMTTSKGTIQGYNELAAVDKKHQIIIDAQAFGEGQEHHTLQPILESVEARYKRLKTNKNLVKDKIIVTADTGFANEANMQYLHENKINGYIPDNKFRSRDPKFADQKEKHGKRHQEDKRKRANRFSPDDFDYDPIKKTCICPGGHSIKLRSERKNELGHDKINFVGYRKKCKECDLKHRCMKTPSSADHYDGCGRQVSFIVEKNKRKANYTDWMKHRVDSPKGKQIYSHRMSVVEPVFGNIGTNKKLNRFSLRGKRKVQGQWQLYCMIHNIKKLKNYGQIAA